MPISASLGRTAPRWVRRGAGPIAATIVAFHTAAVQMVGGLLALIERWFGCALSAPPVNLDRVFTAGLIVAGCAATPRA